ncbi:hypothetical protein BCU84_13470 [Shewanella sp. 10N.286.51.B7]|uniref:hypothetical protein n=1 Tax=Shewanella sp. 10N.286.51.B7 TaxID=1880836 RepID=UPI000C846293|nr:hypothetical protein [Shewanella sp. 10N.286.51.B7]PMG76559.1 hypothetical protein BCU84_13470 [Shewanella sp. 10N.286.51.B7]
MDNEKQYLFDKPKNIQRILYLLYTCCALLVVLDFVIHRHVYHSWENLPAFYPIYGFVGCVILVVVASWMRSFLMRPEDYYGPVEELDNSKIEIVDVSDGHAKEANNNNKGDRDVDA